MVHHKSQDQFKPFAPIVPKREHYNGAMNTPFIFLCCQNGAEAPLKEEVARRYPDFRFAYSRPGFLTYRLPEEHQLPSRLRLGLTFARTCGFALGRCTAETPEARAAEAWKLAEGLPVRALHVWHRLGSVPTEETTAEEESALAALLAAFRTARPEAAELDTGQATQPDDLVLDCIVVEPDTWWIGYHRATPGPGCWPGGFFRHELPEHAVSRAYLKVEEALEWSQFPLREGERCAEIGAAPGGASQALLDRGLMVMGIDPAKMHEDVIAHPNFTHVQKRGNEVKRREFRKVRWLLADMNVAPQYTLDAVEDIVRHEENKIRGVILTLKLPDWELASELDNYLARIRSWGFAEVQARHLHHNRQEICVTACNRPGPARPKKDRRVRKRKTSSSASPEDAAAGDVSPAAEIPTSGGSNNS